MKSSLLRDSVKKAFEFQKTVHEDPIRAQQLMEERKQLLDQASALADEDDVHATVSLKSHLDRYKRDQRLLDTVLRSQTTAQSESLQNGQDQQLLMEMREASSLENSLRGTSELLERAYYTREDLDAQNSILGSVSSRISHLGETFPFLNRILRKASVRRRRDSIILAIVISFFVLLFYFFH
ncbi:SNARE Gos1 [Schizosaccharomyces japonicus yFS275]|uniref:SNARE Gos1 n=1 Tax=Schizosaccharomyces japonicus (strain yFS275 / FY16936) TaxID=402676 RepID=B6K7M3_SCHJY|nr:SNARE Gos1 [Schizosaccharomyces japonicus yFS275]EEB09527.1 SNARE Gos1 [Schizosaccharomyces japonicus yFS275]